MPINKEVLAAGVEILGVTLSALAATVGWLVRSGLSLSKSHTKLEADFTTLKLQVIDHPNRLSKVEEAIVGIQASLAKSEKQFDQIMEKLEVLPRLTTVFDMYDRMTNIIVPRPEVDARVRAVEDRLGRVEDDVREGKE